MSLDDTDRTRVLVVDDEALLRRASGLVLAPHYTVISAACIDAALAELEREAPSVVVSDLDLREDRDGLWLLQEVERRWPSTRRVLLTGHNIQTDDPRLEAVHRLARKPLAASALVGLVAEELSRSRG